MSLRVAVALVLAGSAFAGCGSGGHGRATVWITRDRGAHVVTVAQVPAGLTAMQALDRVADLKTSYAGRYVQSIDGVSGSLTAQHDWFYFVNGYEGDRSAAEYRLHAGDVEWWDYRSWRTAQREPVVVGAFPEPFLHGYDGRRPRVAVVYDTPSLASAARRLGRIVHASAVVSSSTRLMPTVSVLELAGGRARAWVSDDGSGRPGDPVRIVIAGLGRRLAARPSLLRFHYELPR